MRYKIEINMWFIVAVILAIILFNKMTSAQDIIHTQFQQTCIETLSPVHYRLHFGYVSSGIETFAVDTVAPVNIGNTITTEQGQHELGYLDATSDMSMNDYVVTFIGLNDTSELHINSWGVSGECETSSVLPDDTPEPTPDVEKYGCPAWSIDGATGDKFCLWSLPYAEVQ